MVQPQLKLVTPQALSYSCMSGGCRQRAAGNRLPRVVTGHF